METPPSGPVVALPGEEPLAAGSTTSTDNTQTDLQLAFGISRDQPIPLLPRSPLFYNDNISSSRVKTILGPGPWLELLIVCDRIAQSGEASPFRGDILLHLADMDHDRTHPGAGGTSHLFQ